MQQWDAAQLQLDAGLGLQRGAAGAGDNREYEPQHSTPAALNASGCQILQTQSARAGSKDR